LRRGVSGDVALSGEPGMRITNPKLSGVEPATWTPYPGVSLLYEDAGCASSRGVESLERLAAVAARDDELYRQLRGGVDEFVLIARDRGVGLSPLPLYSYHVTLCDAVNQGNRTQVRDPYRQDVDDTLDALPDGLLRSNDLMWLMSDPEPRWRVRRDPVGFRVAGLGVWGHALVARLAPRDGRSLSAAARHEIAREQFASRLDARLGLEVQAWRPHVTLGYLANEDDAARVRDRFLGPWQDVALGRTDGTSVTFVSASVYGFTDMANFWRLGQ
jgi:hypothetical protein